MNMGKVLECENTDQSPDRSGIQTKPPQPQPKYVVDYEDRPEHANKDKRDFQRQPEIELRPF